MSLQDQEEIIDFLETESAGFADQEEEETVNDTIVEQDEGEIFAEFDLEETIEDSHPSELEDIIEEVNRVELRVASNVLKPSATIESDSDSSSSAYSSDSCSDSDSDSDYSTDSMKDSVVSGDQTIKWDGDKATYTPFLRKFQDWMVFNDVHRFYSKKIHPKIHPEGEDAYDDLEVKSKTQRSRMAKFFRGHRKCIAKLRLSVPDTVITGFIDKTKTDEWPIGRLWIVFQRLHKAFYVDDWWAKKQLKIDMEMIVMFNDDEDPDLVYRRLENVQTRYAERPKVKPSCSDLLVQLVDGSTLRYQSLVVRHNYHGYLPNVAPWLC